MKLRKNSLCIIISFVMMLTAMLGALPMTTFAYEGTTAYGNGNPYPAWNDKEGTQRSCTSVAWQCVYENSGVKMPGWHDGGTWLRMAEESGFFVYTSEPEAGDIAVWTGGEYGHVGYILSVDTDSAKMLIYEGGRIDVAYPGISTITLPYEVGSKRNNGTQTLIGFIDPEGNYSGASLKVAPGLPSVNSHFSWKPVEGVKVYNLRIFDSKNKEYSVWNITPDYTNWEVLLPADDYTAWLDACWEDTFKSSSKIKFSVANNTFVSHKVMSDRVHFEWNEVSDAKVYNLRIITSDGLDLTRWNLTENSIDLALPTGSYSYYVNTVFADDSFVTSNTSKFTLSEPLGFSASVDKSTGQVSISWCPDKAVKVYNLRIFDSENNEYSVWNLKTNEWSGSLPKGTYSVYINYCWENSYYTSKTLSIEVPNTVNISTTSTTITPGDANGDGDLTVADAVAILQFIGNRDKYPLDETGKANADVDGEAGITGMDALTIQKVDAGLIDKADLPLKK